MKRPAWLRIRDAVRRDRLLCAHCDGPLTHRRDVHRSVFFTVRVTEGLYCEACEAWRSKLDNYTHGPVI